jgi:four helix bundle protein
MAIRSYRDLSVWQKSMDLAEACYLVTRDFPSMERFGLISQVRRAAVSIPSNIAEGHGTTLAKKFAYHLAMARGSLMELETQILLAERLGYVKRSNSALWELTDEVSRMLVSLRRKVV